MDFVGMFYDFYAWTIVHIHSKEGRWLLSAHIRKTADRLQLKGESRGWYAKKRKS